MNKNSNKGKIKGEVENNQEFFMFCYCCYKYFYGRMLPENRGNVVVLLELRFIIIVETSKYPTSLQSTSCFLAPFI